MSCVSGPTSTSSTTAACEESGDSSAAPTGDAPGELMPGPFATLASSGDIGAQLTTLIVKASHEQKASARECRRSAEAAQRESEDRQLEAMRDAADHSMIAGLVEGAAMVGSGASGLATARSSAITQRYATASSQTGTAGATIAAALFKREAGFDEADRKAAEHDAERAKRNVDDQRDLEKEAKEMLDRALSYYKEYLTAKNETQRATLLRA